MEPIAVTAALLRAQLPDVPLREGASVLARVASRGAEHAVLVIAGIPVAAQVPPEVAAGATLKLRVQEVTAERVLLRIDAPQVPVGAAPAPPPEPRVTVEEAPARRRGADGEPADVVALAFTSPALGRLDLRIELRGARVLAEVTTPAGPAHDVAAAGAERLRANLEAAGLQSTVQVRPRRPPLDLYA
ncbi:MAG TPA: hypothetical protein VNS09_08600 [Solirubrobacter sp.]|nr:hypothetical protein [Solirubrobacter sp.]